MDEVFDYPLLVREALRGLVARLLARVEAEGLPGDHHFYLSFDPSAPGVAVPASLRHRYPEQVTIVLQHQFWGLQVDATGFAVTLRFGGQPEALRVPFSALTAFADPSVPFGFRLDGRGEEASAAGPETAGATDSPEPAGAAKVVDLGAFRKQRRD